MSTAHRIKQEVTECMLQSQPFVMHNLSPDCQIKVDEHALSKQTKIEIDEKQSKSIPANANGVSGGSDMLYGTYDETNHCLTVVLPDDEISHFEEVIEEVDFDDEDEFTSAESLLSPIPSPEGSTFYAGIGNEPKSPLSVSDRDSAYESISGFSPVRSMYMSFSDDELMYNDQLVELFPSLV